MRAQILFRLGNGPAPVAPSILLTRQEHTAARRRPPVRVLAGWSALGLLAGCAGGAGDNRPPVMQPAVEAADDNSTTPLPDSATTPTVVGVDYRSPASSPGVIGTTKPTATPGPNDQMTAESPPRAPGADGGSTAATTSPRGKAPAGVSDSRFDRQLVTDSAQMARAQQLLLAQGYRVGAIDGAVGPSTAAALAAFQADKHLPVSGQLDVGTFTALVAAAISVTDRLPASVVIDLSEQYLSVYNAGAQLITRWPISTGGPGTETPTGSFQAQSRQLVGISSGDARVHMDYFTVFNEDIGFHGIPWINTRDDRLWTPLGEYGVSRGCIRMEDANAEYLYSFLPDGAPVEVRD